MSHMPRNPRVCMTRTKHVCKLLWMAWSTFNTTKVCFHHSIILKFFVDFIFVLFISFLFPDAWSKADLNDGLSVSHKFDNAPLPEFIEKVMKPVASLKGNEILVSSLPVGGCVPHGHMQFEKRMIANKVLTWSADKCSQCNHCSYVCPHGVIRPFLVNKGQIASCPDSFKTMKANGGGYFDGFNYHIQVSPYDCTGCQLCVNACPDDDLAMKPVEEMVKQEADNWYVLAHFISFPSFLLFLFS